MTPGTRTVFIDVLFILLCVLILLPHNPETEDDSKPPGQLVVEIRWADGLNADVDLWVQAPNDRPVGYSNRAGDTMNLLRDDLGMQRDALNLNYETAYSRGLPDGEYVVNVHMYRNADAFPVMVTVAASTTTPTQVLFTKIVSLTKNGEEITVARFTMKNGAMVPDSMHDFPKKLRM